MVKVTARVSRDGSSYSIFTGEKEPATFTGERVEYLGYASHEFLKSREWRFAIGRKSITELKNMIGEKNVQA